MKSLSQFIESEKINGKTLSISQIRSIIIEKKDTFERIMKSSTSKKSIETCKIFIEELENLYNKTLQYDIMQNTLKTIKSEQIPNLLL